MKYLHTRHRFIKHLPMLPFITGALLFIFLLDIWVELYHRIAFPLYGFKYVKRRDYIKIDRYKLSYLHPFQKVNCIYCGYVNGALKYISEIVGETEKYWCGIKHAEREGFNPPAYHDEFLEYNDEDSFKEVYKSKKTSML